MIRSSAALRLLLALVVIAPVAVVGCDESEAPPGSALPGSHPTTLAGTSWIVTQVGLLRPPRGTQPTMAFDATKVQGSAGCNQFGGRYRYEPSTGELRFDELGMTAMACAEPARNEVETAFVRSLGGPLVATIQADGHLVLVGAAGARIDLDVVGPTVTD